MKTSLKSIILASCVVCGSVFANSDAIQKSNFGGIGVQLADNAQGVEVIRVIEGSPAEESGLKVGDIVVGINDKNAAGLNMGEVIHSIRGEEGTPVYLDVIRNSKSIEFEVARTGMELTLSDFKKMNLENADQREVLNKSELSRHLETAKSAKIFVDNKALEKDYVAKPKKEQFSIFSVDMKDRAFQKSDFLKDQKFFNGPLEVELPEAGSYEIEVYTLKGELKFQKLELAFEKNIQLDISEVDGAHLVVVKQNNFRKSFQYK